MRDARDRCLRSRNSHLLQICRDSESRVSVSGVWEFRNKLWRGSNRSLNIPVTPEALEVPSK
jgi:hypothetical protein